MVQVKNCEAHAWKSTGGGKLRYFMVQLNYKLIKWFDLIW